MNTRRSIEFTPAALQTLDWIQSAVVGLKLCPFAAATLVGERLRITTTTATIDSSILEILEAELQWLTQSPADAPETTLLILTTGYISFYEFVQLVEICNRYIARTHREGQFQLAHFHPQYHFQHLDPDDVRNYTNRSPYPTLHLLR
ncbi:MAG: DUF1415 family protein, partial [Gemmataceae bacterium]